MKYITETREKNTGVFVLCVFDYISLVNKGI